MWVNCVCVRRISQSSPFPCFRENIGKHYVSPLSPALLEHLKCFQRRIFPSCLVYVVYTTAPLTPPPSPVDCVYIRRITPPHSCVYTGILFIRLTSPLPSPVSVHNAVTHLKPPPLQGTLSRFICLSSHVYVFPLTFMSLLS